jgi:hypothetical protein
MFRRSTIRIYELLFIILASTSVNLLTSDLRSPNLNRRAITADVLLLAGSVCLFVLYADMSALWEDKLRNADPIGDFNQSIARRSRLTWLLLVAIVLVVGSFAIIGLGPNATDALPQPPRS